MNEPSYRLLLLDDDPQDLLILQRRLGRMQGLDCQWTPCESAGAALEALQNQTFHLLLTDYLLGSETGLDFFHRLRKLGHAVPVILMTGHGDESIAVESMKAGVSDYLIKGQINEHELFRAIAGALEKDAMRRTIEKQQEELIQAEKKHAMVESVMAASHHLSQPLTALMGSLQLAVSMAAERHEDRDRLLQKSMESCKQILEVVRALQNTREYRTVPYVRDTRILDLGLTPNGAVPPPPQAEPSKGEIGLRERNTT